MKDDGDRPLLFSGLNLRGLNTWGDTNTVTPRAHSCHHHGNRDTSLRGPTSGSGQRSGLWWVP